MLIVRNAIESDLNLIRDSFVKSVKDVCSEMTNGLSTNALRSLINKAVLYDWKVTVICDDETKNEVMAWIVHRGNDLLWVARKPRYSGIKLGMRLFASCIPKGIVNCAFLNPRLTQSLMSLGYNCKLRPYITTEIMSYD